MTEDSEGPSPKAIGRRLALTRQVLGLQQNEFAEKAGIAAPTYNEFEKGKTRPSIDKARLLRRTYHLTHDWIYEGDLSGLRYELADAIKALRATRTKHPKQPFLERIQR